MRRFVPLLAGFSLAFAPAPLPREDVSEKDLQGLQGTWSVVYTVTNGVTEACEPAARWVITGDCLVYTANGETFTRRYIRLGPKERVRRLDLLSSRIGIITLLGRYSLIGDTLTVCLSRGATRPPDLFSADPMHVTCVLKRKTN
jgi:uncharacterized protein (TIGR03067 family)